MRSMFPTGDPPATWRAEPHAAPHGVGPAGRRHGERRRPDALVLAPLRWITALQGRELRVIAVEDICYCRSDHKYTAVVTVDGEALIRMPLRELATRLDPATFWQIHRGTVVNAHAIRSVRRDDGGAFEVRLKTRDEGLKVSEAYAHRFKHL